ncbi:MAG: UDP binding domain-containing protein, partial [Acidobacteriota bacterium]
GAAIDDFLRPDRVVIGTEDPEAGQEMRELYAPFTRTGAPVLVMDTRSAEMSKYASNAMLACRISFMNEVANLCEQLGADVSQVRNAVGADKRIGRSFLFPGVGYGGSCFPKDIQALIRMGRDSGYPLELIETIEKVNQRQKTVLVGKIDRLFSSEAIPMLEGLSTHPDDPVKAGGPLPDQLRKLACEAQAGDHSASCSPDPATLSGRTFAVWGLSFKPRTDDMREAPSLGIISNLLHRGAAIRAYDPEAMNEAQKIFGDSIRCCENNYQALQGADALILITEWNVFRNPDFGRMKGMLRLPVIFDGRNQYNPAEMTRLGFLYFGIGTR